LRVFYNLISRIAWSDPVVINKNGFLVNFGDWAPEVAKAMAEEEHLKLVDCHWVAFKYMRDYYAQFEIAPSPHIMIKEIGAELDSHKCTRKTLEQIFPGGGCKQACRIAGLPESFCYAC